MNAHAPWYNADRVAQPGSVILTEWKAQRESARSGQVQASTPIGDIKPGAEMFDILTGSYGQMGAGIPVTEHSVMAIGAVYACVSIIGGALASLPFHLYKRLAEGRERFDSDLWWLFNESPWPTWTAASAWSFATQSIGLKGDGFWRIHRVSPFSNAIQGFEPYHPDRVFVIQEKGRNYYTVTNVNGTQETIDQDDMLHFPGIGFDGRRSITPIRAALRPAGGIALAADEFASAFFRNGARPDFALTTPGKLSQDAAQLLRTTWADRHSGPSNAHLPAVLSGGLDVKELTMSAEDAQLLSTRQFQVQDIARIFGVPPHMIGYTEKSTNWGSGIEQMSIGFVRYTLRRYIDAMAQEINRKIWPRSRIYFGEHNTDALLDGDSKAQAEYFAKALGGPGNQGWMTINEIRRLKNLKPIDGGDKLVFAGASQSSLKPTQPDIEDPEDPETDPLPEEEDAPDAQAAGQ